MDLSTFFGGTPPSASTGSMGTFTPGQTTDWNDLMGNLKGAYSPGAYQGGLGSIFGAGNTLDTMALKDTPADFSNYFNSTVQNLFQPAYASALTKAGAGFAPGASTSSSDMLGQQDFATKAFANSIGQFGSDVAMQEYDKSLSRQYQDIFGGGQLSAQGTGMALSPLQMQLQGLGIPQMENYALSLPGYGGALSGLFGGLGSGLGMAGGLGLGKYFGWLGTTSPQTTAMVGEGATAAESTA